MNTDSLTNKKIMKNKSIFAQLITLIMWLMITLLTTTIILLMLAMFVGLFSAVSPAQTLSLLYRYVVPEHFKTEQLIETADGKHISVQTNKYWYTSKYSLTLETEDYPAWIYEDSSRPVGELTFPVTFDVVKSVPWIVLPIRGAKCSEYGFPREGFATFKLDNKMWKQVPNELAPTNLRVNLSHVYDYKEKITPEIRQNLYVVLYNSGQMHQYVNEDGSGKAIKESAKLNMGLPYIADTSSCYYLNPPVDPDEKRSLGEFAEMGALQVKESELKARYSGIGLGDSEEIRILNPLKISSDCDKIVTRHYEVQLAKENQSEFTHLTGVREGTFVSVGLAERVEISASSGAQLQSLYIPIKGFSFERINQIHCQPDRIIVSYGGDMNSLQIFEYDRNARLQKKWLVQLNE